MREEETHEPPECLVEILTKQLGGDISEGLSEVVESMLKQREKDTYDSLTGDDDKYYIEAMLNNQKKKNQSNLDFIANAMGNRSSKVQSDLFMGGLEIMPEVNLNTKKQLEFMAKLDVARMIKIKEGQLRSKMDLLHEKIDNLQAVQSWNGVNED